MPRRFSGCLKLPASCLLPSSLSLCTIKSMQRSCSCSKLRFEEAGTKNCSLPLDRNCFVALCGWCVWLFGCLSQGNRISFSPLFLHLQMDTNTRRRKVDLVFAHERLLLCHFLSSFIALIFFFFLNVPLTLPHPLDSTAKCFDLPT